MWNRSHLACLVPGSSGGTGIETVCDPPSLHALGVGGRADQGMMIGGALSLP